jgi:hypothetical protein
MVYTWLPMENGNVGDAAQNGWEANGEPLYVCYAEFNGGYHPGKVRPAFGAANIPWGGLENKVPRYWVLMEAGNWKGPYSGGNFPPNAYDAEHPRCAEAGGALTLWFARAAVVDGSCHPGKIREAFGGANIPYGGQEVKQQLDYYILMP